MDKKYSLDWMDDGNCTKDDEAAEMLTSENTGTRNEAKQRYCKGCPVIKECLGYALAKGDNSMHIMGGLDGKQRSALSQSHKNLAIMAFKGHI